MCASGDGHACTHKLTSSFGDSAPFHVRCTWGVKHLCGHQRNWEIERRETNQQREGLKKKKRRLPPETWLLWTRFKWGACSFVVRKDKVHNWQQTTNTHTGTLFKLGLFSSSTFFGCGTSNARSNLFISSYFNSPFHFTFLFSWRNFFFLSTWKSFTPHEDN